MNGTARSRSRRAAGALRQAGMGMIELLIVILISLFMLAGMFALVYGSRQNFLAQNQLAQLQDSERLALTILAQVVQSAGYYPNPTVATSTQALPATGVFGAAGQSVYGVTGDAVTVRYVEGTSDGVMDCTGQTNTSGAAMNKWNTFAVVGGQLVCTVTSNGIAGAAVPLVSGVTAMTVLYGVDQNGDSSADQYLPAAAVTAAGSWNSVVSVKVSLTFANPTTGTNTQMAANAAALTITRNIDLLNRI